MNTRQKSSHALSVLPGALFMCLLFKNVWVRMNNQFYYSKKKSASCSAYRFFRQPPFQVQIPGSTFQNEKNPQAFQLTDFSGGKRGIRTLGGFMAHTRFPVVRLRPAQPSFHLYFSARQPRLYIIPDFAPLVNTCFLIFEKNPAPGIETPGAGKLTAQQQPSLLLQPSSQPQLG